MEFNSPYPTAIPAELARILPFTATRQDFSLLGSGATDTLTMAPPPADSFLVGGGAYVRTAVTAGGGDTTGMTVEIGDAAASTQVMAAIDLVGVTAGTWVSGTQLSANLLEATAYVPITTARATGGSTELDHIDAGEWVMALFFANLPDGEVAWDLGTQGAAA